MISNSSTLPMRTITAAAAHDCRVEATMGQVSPDTGPNSLLRTLKTLQMIAEFPCAWPPNQRS